MKDRKCGAASRLRVSVEREAGLPRTLLPGRRRRPPRTAVVCLLVGLEHHQPFHLDDAAVRGWAGERPLRRGRPRVRARADATTGPSSRGLGLSSAAALASRRSTGQCDDVGDRQAHAAHGAEVVVHGVGRRQRPPTSPCPRAAASAVGRSMSTLPEGSPAEGSPRWYHRSAFPTRQAPSMLRTSASTDRAAATAEYTCAMSATTARGSPCSSRRSDHRIRAGDDPDPIINAAGASSTVTWQAASRSGLRCLVPDASSNTFVPVDRREEPHGSHRPLTEPGSMGGVVRHDKRPPPKGTTAEAARTGAPSLNRSRSTPTTSTSMTKGSQTSREDAVCDLRRPVREVPHRSHAHRGEALGKASPLRRDADLFSRRRRRGPLAEGSSPWTCRTTEPSPTRPSTATPGSCATRCGSPWRWCRSSRPSARSSRAPRVCPRPTSGRARPRSRTPSASTSWPTSEPLVVADAREDPRLRDNLAIEDLDVIAYAGWPLRDHNGRVIGSLCAIDSEPREWTAHEIQMLEDLAASCSAEIAQRELRRIADDGIDYATHLVWRANVLLQLSQALTATRTVTDVATALEDVTREHLGCHHAAMWLHSAAATLDAFGQVRGGRDARADRLLLCESRPRLAPRPPVRRRAGRLRHAPGRRLPPAACALLRRTRRAEPRLPRRRHHQRDGGGAGHRAAGRRRPGLRRRSPCCGRRSAPSPTTTGSPSRRSRRTPPRPSSAPCSSRSAWTPRSSSRAPW